MMKHLKSILCLALILALALQLGGCAGGTPEAPVAAKVIDLMAEITPAKPEAAPVKPEAAEAATDFSLRLFKAGRQAGENTLISPISVLSALAMTANGAKGETLAQMEQVLGMDREALNGFFRTWLEALAKDPALKAANSIWFTQDRRFTVNRDFLQTNADYYGADVYQAPFDNSTLAAINDWVKEKTDGMIPEILDQIPPNVVMYLVNALAFDAKWEVPYEKASVQSGNFLPENGEKVLVDFMQSEEHLYLEDDKAVGFLKPYEGGKYAFMALLPKEGVSLADCADSLDGAAFRALLAGQSQETVFTALPKFETGWNGELSELLRQLGMGLAFDPEAADFSGLGSAAGGNIGISRVLHKTFLSVAEEGTRAGAATVVEMDTKGVLVEAPKYVTLDRPFLYALVDLENGIPLFIGSMMNPA